MNKKFSASHGTRHGAADTNRESVTPLAVFRGQTMASGDKLAFSTKETCAALGISSTSLWRLERQGLIRAVRVLRTPLYPRKEIERFLGTLEMVL